MGVKGPNDPRLDAISPVELAQAGEDHWMSRGQTRLEMLTASMAFLERHNPPQ